MGNAVSYRLIPWAVCALLSGCAGHIKQPSSKEDLPSTIPGKVTPDVNVEASAASASLADSAPILAPATPAPAPTAAFNFAQTGIASCYARRFQGRRTASGERFDMHALTAAHRTLPLGSYARVSNASRTRSVIVRINDRGPFVKGRVIDLSSAAAKALGMSEAGTQSVIVEGVRREDHVIVSAKRSHPYGHHAHRRHASAAHAHANVHRHS
ncbi:rare lipoprotein A [Burkholderia sp. YI23]|nr:rare lipoprotein A [Burkholderia sp. YI23]